ncbi:hypothetical protein EYB53_024820 [Candidatus Chloroploca sp. M-50]|uniref:CpXC domain-containing protein n=1 Tax=Candidatus Chloroploca mongolica TaxID=2528176 RepID=A0ABS4DHQ4_9CHLR|nr:hypothetical protein [Candidatus Chloroploca mongolica]MBP1468955.1 hypothetical protein [Candidatus Chloroploca mongolica]
MPEKLQDVILLRRCPACKAQHFYAVEIERAPFLGANPLPVRPLKITRLFTCPTQDEDFMIEFYLIQPTRVSYQRVQMIGLLADPADGSPPDLSTHYFDQAGLSKYLRANGVSNASLLVPPGGLPFGPLNIVCVIQ